MCMNLWEATPFRTPVKTAKEKNVSERTAMIHPNAGFSLFVFPSS